MMEFDESFNIHDVFRERSKFQGDDRLYMFSMIQYLAKSIDDLQYQVKSLTAELTTQQSTPEEPL